MSHQDFAKCNEVLLENFNLYFTFDKSRINQAKKEIKKNYELWVRTATKNRKGKRIEWQIQFPSRPITINTHQHFTTDQLSSIYMLEGDGVEDWAGMGCLLVARPGDELETLKKMRIANKFVPTKSFEIRNFNNWTTIRENSTPCTDVIVVDRYLFAQTEIDCEVNSYALLKELCHWTKASPTNIVIFTMKSYKDGNTYVEIPYRKIVNDLKDQIEKTTGVKPHITIVFMDQEKHDRTILTNYSMYSSGDSFTYFKNGKEVSLGSHGDWLYISSLYDEDNHQHAKNFLNDLQALINNPKGNANPIYGDMKSLFLSFS